MVKTVVHIYIFIYLFIVIPFLIFIESRLDLQAGLPHTPLEEGVGGYVATHPPKVARHLVELVEKT